MTISDPALRARAQSMEVELRMGDLRFAKTFEIAGAIDDGAVSFAVVLDPPPTHDFEIEMRVVAYSSSGARGEIVAEGSAAQPGSRDACNRIRVELADQTEDAGVGDPDAGPPEVGPKDAGEGFLIVEPEERDLPWVDRSDVLTFSATVSEAAGRALDDLTATATVSWVSVQLSPASGTARRILTVTVDTGPFLEGPYAGTVLLESGDASIAPAQFRFRFRVFRPIRIGPAADACNPTCDFVGENGLQAAESSITPYSHVILHGPATYNSEANGIDLPETSWISAARGLAPSDIVLRCRDARGLVLEGDGVLVERLMIVSEGDCDQVISSWISGTPEDGTGGHRIDRVVLAAVRPEVYNSNGIDEIFGLSEDTIVSNSYAWGYWQELGSLAFAHRTRLVNNTFIFYQRGDPIVVDGAEGVTIANNVFVSVPPSTDPLITGDAATHGLTLVGNVVEGFDGLAEGLDAADTSNVIANNVEGTAPLDTPRDPRFLSDAAIVTSSSSPGIGRSLDDVDVDGRTDVLPGAFQVKSPRAGPRRSVIRLGPASCTDCDVTSAEANEVQVAAWSVWSGGAIEIEPGFYAGNAVISWETSIAGLGDSPYDVSLRSNEEDPLLANGDTWAHESVITMIDENRRSFSIENLTIRVDSNDQADESAVLIESNPNFPPAGPLVARNLVILSGDASSGGLRYGLMIGENVLVQDVIVRGEFESCLRIAHGFPSGGTPPAVRAYVVNLTCRLTGVDLHRPYAAFELANADYPRLINIAVETATTTPLFGAQRRSTGDTGANVRDPPDGIVAHRISWSRGPLFGGFDASSGTYTLVGVQPVPPNAPFFAGPTDDHLAPGSPAIDSGVDPSTVQPDLAPGVSIDGVDRSGRQIDRGAHEQGS